MLKWKMVPLSMNLDLYYALCRKYPRYKYLCQEVLFFDVLDSNAILNFLTERDIKTLYHFTPVNNLYSIFINGICPVSELKRRNIDFIQPDNKRLDGRYNAVSLSISKPNQKLLKAKAEYEFDIPFCIIELDSSLLFEFDNVKEFFPTNAAHYKKELREHPFTSLSDLQSMFGDGTCFPKDEQAEVLFHGIIPIRYINRVHFQHDEDILPELSPFRNLFSVNAPLFGFQITQIRIF